jgi:hypothetical protein
MVQKTDQRGDLQDGEGPQSPSVLERQPMLTRIVTSAAVMAVAVAMLVFGTSFVRFTVLESRIEALASPTLVQDALPEVESFQQWPGVAASARDLVFRVAADDAARAARVASALAVAPCLGAGWAQLALLRAKLGAPVEAVSSALRMSELVSPHEGSIMVDRALIGLWLWDKLDPEQQGAVIREMIATRRIPKAELRYREMLLNGSVEAQLAVTDRLHDAGADGEATLEWLGLEQ